MSRLHLINPDAVRMTPARPVRLASAEEAAAWLAQLSASDPPPFTALSDWSVPMRELRISLPDGTSKGLRGPEL